MSLKKNNAASKKRLNTAIKTIKGPLRDVYARRIERGREREIWLSDAFCFEYGVCALLRKKPFVHMNKTKHLN
jgi:hypothetical protein